MGIRKSFSRFLAGSVLSTLCLAGSIQANTIDKTHFLVPGGAGGGWDSTARGIGEAMNRSGILERVSYENMSGGGGGRAIAYLIETAQRQQGTLMVNSTPIVIRSLQKVFPQSFRDLTPVAAVIGDYGILAVRADSDIKTFDDALKQFRENPRKLKIAGGSVAGSMDHLIAAMVFQAAGENPRKVRYIPYDAGGKAMAGLLSGETDLLATGLGEALEMQRSGKIRIIGVTANKRLTSAPNIPTFAEQKGDATFVNWRGVFGPPNLPAEKVEAYASLFEKMYQTPEWKQIRDTNGWVEIFKSGDDFMTYLNEQERDLGILMRQMGFLQ
ncbi:tripartite tricarboxylate transporter substrate-binding protein [Endozoicomonas gorgoniicola]|uniref:Tripartite tricarboxylate transporter substrate-binding protein n=1 Tax=Endozoicomonas gorgoniicola TaxID=1234144 RepID=A0ABT3MUI1_9GAMM|nr:tripartite tricarboxylate transporter substrate-binding protein [Endozoicomonas gorgoniicola]MCW7553040.1 tripartite tricarboxylate transporter substrate-binding protein [Endozoicomonas gorgoniicola]